MTNTKDLSWFSHDSNAKDQPKCMLIIDQMGLEAYGIFWILIETLREQNDYKYPLALIPSLARKYNTTLAKMETIIYNYDLFKIEENNFFWNGSLTRRMQFLENKKLQQIEAGKRGVAAKKAKAKRLLSELSEEHSSNQPSNDPKAIKEKETKLKQSKLNKTLSLNQFRELFQEQYHNRIFSVKGTIFTEDTTFKLNQTGYIVNLVNRKLLNKEDALDVWSALHKAYHSDSLENNFRGDA